MPLCLRWLLVLALLVAGCGPVAPAVPTPIVPTAEVARPTSAVDECRRRVEALDAELALIEADLMDRKGTVEQLDARLDALRSDVAMFDSTYPRGVPASLYDAYTSAVDEYNATLRHRRALALEYNAGVDAFDARLQQRNTLAATC